MQARSAVFVNLETRPLQVIFDVFQNAFLAAPACFKPPETLVTHRGSPKIQFLASMLAQPADAFPHHQVVRPCLLLALVGRAELINTAPSAKKIAPATAIWSILARTRTPSPFDRMCRAMFKKNAHGCGGNPCFLRVMQCSR